MYMSAQVCAWLHVMCMGVNICMHLYTHVLILQHTSEGLRVPKYMKSSLYLMQILRLHPPEDLVSLIFGDNENWEGLRQDRSWMF